jgi:hypothetical protein
MNNQFLQRVVETTNTFQLHIVRIITIPPHHQSHAELVVDGQHLHLHVYQTRRRPRAEIQVKSGISGLLITRMMAVPIAMRAKRSFKNGAPLTITGNTIQAIRTRRAVSCTQ